MSIIVIIAGSTSDQEFVGKIKDEIEKRSLISLIHTHFCSAHKETERVLEIVKRYDEEDGVIFITVAGLSNALSGVVSTHTRHTVIACPPFKSTADYMVDIHSTLRMASDIPVLTVISPGNCALAVVKLLEAKYA